MNATYNYKTGKNNIEFASKSSKKGTCKTFVSKRSASEDFVERSLSFIDNIIEILSSPRTLVVAKALFAFIALLGFFGVIGGIELGTVSLLTGTVALALLIGFEYIILRD
jgi:hypothetical protein